MPVARYAPRLMPDPVPARERALAAIVDAFAPGGDGLPAASSLGVHRRLLAEIEALGRPSFSRELDMLLRLVESRVANLAVVGRPVRFSALDQQSREAYLRRLGGSPVPLLRTAFQDLKRLTLLLTYGLEDSPWRAMTGYVPPPADPPSISQLHVRTPAPGEEVDVDAVVIGSGAGGAVAAAVLAAAGHRVVVLERAAMVAEDRFGGPELEGLASLFLDRGLAATADRWIAIRAGSAVGGGTVVNWSTSLRAPAAVRDEWRAAGIGDDLDEHYAAVEAEMDVTTGESELNGPNAMLAAGLAALGLPAQVVPRNVRGCGDCGPCAVGCRRGAKRSALRTYLAAACRDGATILDRAEARRVTVLGGRVTGVVARVPGGEITVRAPLVALAGGSILSPAVLLRSGIASGTAGRTLHIHPVAGVAGVYADALEPWAGVPQGVLSEAYAEVDGTWGFRLEAAPTHPGLIASGFPWWSSADHRALMAQSARTAAFIAIVRDRSTGRVELARDGGITVRYAPGAAERALLQRGMLELARVHRAAGARHIVPLLTPPLGWKAGEPFEPYLDALGRRSISPNRVLLFTAHQMSSCRIGASPRDSVADPDGRVWGVDGLYVTDASALPTATGVNPMLSIMALARRTAARMAAR
jgi:choline dehydrogenase-like flavoprotein